MAGAAALARVSYADTVQESCSPACVVARAALLDLQLWSPGVFCQPLARSSCVYAAHML